jgi:WD40 repeat protein
MRLPRLTLNQGGSVSAVAITPDGKTIFSGGAPTLETARLKGNIQADVFVWDTASGKLIRRLHGFYWRANAVTASPAGNNVIASGFTERDMSDKIAENKPDSILAWDWRSGQKVWAMAGSMPLSYSPDGRLIGCSDGVRQAVNGKLVIPIPKGLDEDSQTEFSPDGTLFGFIGPLALNKKGVIYSEAGVKLYYSTMRLHLWHTDTGKEAQSFPFTRVRAFDMAPNGQWLVIAGDSDHMTGVTDGSVVRRVNRETGGVAWTRERFNNAPDHDPDAALNSIAISPNGKYIVLQSYSSQLIVLDAATGRELFRPFASQSGMGSSWTLPGGLAFSKDGKSLVSRSGPRVLVWDATSLQ